MILVFGTICVDRVRLIEKLPQSGGYVEVQREQLFLGGEAANTAVALSRWKAEVRLLSNRISPDDDGKLIIDRLSQLKLPFEPAPQTNLITPVCDIYITPDGDRTMFGQGFSRMTDAFDPEQFVKPGDGWFTAEPNMGSFARDVVRKATESGYQIYLMDFFQPNDPIASGSFWQSSTDWVGVRGNTQKNVEWVKRHVAEHGCFTILSDGPNGFVAGSAKHKVRAYPPYPAPTVIDSTGAGDLFRAGMLFGLNEKWPIKDCLRFASVAGCLACGNLGGSEVIPTRGQIENHLLAHDDVGKQYD